uniref:HTH CENPB-type domain-containing protein n=1 Tax=Romanomermis culicivorax TaxID=13658 RepID=A0A915ICI9_ROMCU
MTDLVLGATFDPLLVRILRDSGISNKYLIYQTPIRSDLLQLCLVPAKSCIVTMPKNIISLETKLKIINDASESSYAELGEKYGLHKPTIGTIMRQKDQLLEKAESGYFGKNMKRMRVAAELEIERCLLQWLRRARAENVPISGPLLQKKAQDFARQLGKVEFKCCNGW